MKGQAVLNAAAGVAGRAMGLKVGAVGSVVFLIALVLLGSFSGSGESAAGEGSNCPGNADVGDIGDTGLPPSQDQITNAKIIDGVAAKRKLPGRATLIALMTALQESGLRNIDYGDRDSVGLFQQRPSAGWGTVQQIMNPEYSANAFFGGRGAGHPRGLVDVKDWQVKPLGVVAQTVQVSAFPALYAPREGQARTIARKAGIDLGRSGESGSSTAPVIDGGSSCTDGGGTPGKPGEPFHDGNASWPAQVKNPRSTADAIAWAKREVNGGPDWLRMCLAFTARSYGWGFSGTPYAIDHYQKVMPASMRHDRDRNPPPGALMYWDTGSRAGHVAVYVGDGKIASNDIKRAGYIDVVPATDPETKWGAEYLGWSPPYYPKGG
ncbi:peptidase M23 [Streptomyces sp. NPDC005805]|uniref:peptidase M23 n=1 Tax=Streptomyces sp. NPDC005805 TaxID=3157068 RepID=UPI00340088BD